MLFTAGLNWVNNGQNSQSDLRTNFYNLLFIQDQKSMLTSQLQPALFSSGQSDFCTILLMLTRADEATWYPEFCCVLQQHTWRLYAVGWEQLKVSYWVHWVINADMSWYVCWLTHRAEKYHKLWNKIQAPSTRSEGRLSSHFFLFCIVTFGFCLIK